MPGMDKSPSFLQIQFFDLTGERGPPGLRGDPGLTSATIRDWKIDRARYLATPLMSDGREGPPLKLRALFEQFWLETR